MDNDAVKRIRTANADIKALGLRTVRMELGSFTLPFVFPIFLSGLDSLDPAFFLFMDMPSFF